MTAPFNAPILRSAQLARAFNLNNLNSPAPARRQAAPVRQPTTFATHLATATAKPMPALTTAAVPFADLINAAAGKAGVDPALVAAIARVESGFNPQARSTAGARGLMQLMDATARRLGVSDAFDPAQSLDAGARFLGGLLKQFNGDVRLALAAYNAGPDAVRRYGGIPPYQETQRYVPEVLASADEFRRISADQRAAPPASHPEVS